MATKTLDKEGAGRSISQYFQSFFASVRSWKRFLKVDIILAALFLASLVSPTITAVTRISVKYYALFFALYVVWFITAILRYRKQGKKFLIDKSRYKEVIAMLVWLVLLAVNVLLGRGEGGTWAVIYTVMFMTVYVMDYVYSMYNDRSVLKALMVFVLVVFAIESLRSIAILHTHPHMARWFNAFYDQKPEYYFPFELRGLGDYPFFTAGALAIPVFLHMVVKSKHRILLGIAYLSVVAGIFYSGYTGSTMLVFTTLLFVLIYATFFYKNKKRKRAFLIIVALTVVLITILFAFCIHDEMMEDYRFKYRDLASVILGKVDIEINVDKPPVFDPNHVIKKGDATISRMSLYIKSIETFLRNPFFGVGPFFRTATIKNGIGGHSSWLDFLAMYGIVQCLPLILCFYFYFRRNMKQHTYAVNKVMRFLPWLFFMGYGLVNPVYVARCFPVALCLFIGGNSPRGLAVPIKDLFRGKKKVALVSNIDE